MAQGFLLGFGSWLSGPCVMYIDNFFASGTEYSDGSNFPVHLLFFSESWLGDEAYPVMPRFVCHFLKSSVSSSNAAVQRLNVNEDPGLGRGISITFLNFCLAFSLHLLGHFSVSGFLVRSQNFFSCYILDR